MSINDMNPKISGVSINIRDFKIAEYSQDEIDNLPEDVKQYIKIVPSYQWLFDLKKAFSDHQKQTRAIDAEYRSKIMDLFYSAEWAKESGI